MAKENKTEDRQNPKPLPRKKTTDGSALSEQARKALETVRKLKERLSKNKD